jgi:hypothetical protein
MVGDGGWRHLARAKDRFGKVAQGNPVEPSPSAENLRSSNAVNQGIPFVSSMCPVFVDFAVTAIQRWPVRQ